MQILKYLKISKTEVFFNLFFDWRIIALQNFVVFCQTSRTEVFEIYILYVQKFGYGPEPAHYFINIEIRERLLYLEKKNSPSNSVFQSVIC